MFSRLVVLILLVWTHAYGLNVVADCGAIPCDNSGVCVDSWAAFQKCANARTVFVPAGEFMIGSTVQVGADAGNQQQSWTLRGEGWTSRLRWAHNGTLFEFPEGGRNVFISSIAIVGNGVSPKAVEATVFSFSSLALSEFHNVLMDSSGGSFFRTRDYIDTVSFTDCVLWEMTGVGYTLAEGAEVRIRGGRIVGPSLSTHLQNDSSIGVLITGNCGGVHVHGTDVIALGTGVLANNSSGKGSNRELFFTQATFDSNIIGVHIQDNSYVSVAGLWAASSLAHQVLIEGETAQFVAAGGTIFNGGVYFILGNKTVPLGYGNGITALGGTVTLSGIEIRNNQHRGVWQPKGSTASFLISGSRWFGNGQDISSEGSAASLVSGCMCARPLNATLWTISASVGC